MKLYKISPLTLVLLFSCCKEKELEVDAVAGRPMIQLDEGKPYILHTKNGGYQIEITINRDGYGIVQLANDGTGEPPILISSENNNITTMRTLVDLKKNGLVSSVISDNDGDGLPESRMVTERADGVIKRVKRDEILINFKSTGERIIDEK